jgi:DNA-binding CsgD family transcriptional regulator
MLTSPSHLGFTLSEPIRSLWTALVEDTNSGVMVADGDGVVLYANAPALRTFSKGTGSPVGKHLSDIWDEKLAHERLDILKQCAASHQVMHLEGFVNGRWIHSTIRPLPDGEGGQVRVLMVCRGSRPAELGNAPKDEAIQARENDAGSLNSLTHRELEILKLIGEGLSTAQIAEHLGRSVKTIEWHRVSLGNKLGVRNRVELARIAINAGFVDPEDRVASRR